MESIQANVTLDAKGLACPMPIVRTKKMMNELQPGQVLEVQATDKGSKADLKAWANSVGHQYLGTIEEDHVLKHYVRKSSGEETAERKHDVVVSNEQLELKLQSESGIVLLDVREAAEYAFNHIPNAISIPLSELELRLQELNQDQDIYIVCRSGNRSDMAANMLTANGFSRVTNVVPGMSQWTGKTIGV